MATRLPGITPQGSANVSNVFHTYHPAVACAFLACALVLTMACLQPAFVAVSLAGALACSAVCRGGRATVLSLRWVVPLCLVVAAANPFFVASGSTELFHVGQRAIYLEALAYGLCSGGMFAAVFLWFASYAACMDSENSLALFGNAAPVVTLMVSQVLRLVPQFVSRGRAIAAAQDAVSEAAPVGRRDAALARLRVVNVLVGWGMEDALERSDAMRARGYDCGIRRTSYKRFRLGRGDALVLAIVLLLVAASAVGAWAACASYSFYPVMDGVGPWQCVVPYALLVMVPPALWLREWKQWRACE